MPFINVIIETSKYRLEPNPEQRNEGWSYWLTNKDGEGMAVSDDQLDRLFDKLFEEEF